MKYLLLFLVVYHVTSAIAATITVVNKTGDVARITQFRNKCQDEKVKEEKPSNGF